MSAAAAVPKMLPAISGPTPSARVSTETSADRPGRSSPDSGLSVGTAMRTGMRWTTLVKLPVAFSGGSRLNWAPLAGAKLSTVPCRV